MEEQPENLTVAQPGQQDGDMLGKGHVLLPLNDLLLSLKFLQQIDPETFHKLIKLPSK